jgi:hypothetical protein
LLFGITYQEPILTGLSLYSNKQHQLNFHLLSSVWHLTKNILSYESQYHLLTQNSESAFLLIHRMSANPMPPANIEATVMKLLSPSILIPLIPCPLGQPPAIRAPNTMISPPRTPLSGDIAKESLATAAGTAVEMARLLARIPPANAIALDIGTTAFVLDFDSLSPEPKRLQTQRPISS